MVLHLGTINPLSHSFTFLVENRRYVVKHTQSFEVITPHIKLVQSPLRVLISFRFVDPLFLYFIYLMKYSRAPD